MKMTDDMRTKLAIVVIVLAYLALCICLMGPHPWR